MLNILVSVQIMHGTRRQLIYTSDFTTFGPYYTHVPFLHIATYRVWNFSAYFYVTFQPVFFKIKGTYSEERVSH